MMSERYFHRLIFIFHPNVFVVVNISDRMPAQIKKVFLKKILEPNFSIIHGGHIEFWLSQLSQHKESSNIFVKYRISKSEEKKIEIIINSNI